MALALGDRSPERRAVHRGREEVAHIPRRDVRALQLPLGSLFPGVLAHRASQARGGVRDGQARRRVAVRHRLAPTLLPLVLRGDPRPQLLRLVGIPCVVHLELLRRHWPEELVATPLEAVVRLHVLHLRQLGLRTPVCPGVLPRVVRVLHAHRHQTSLIAPELPSPRAEEVPRLTALVVDNVFRRTEVAEVDLMLVRVVQDVVALSPKSLREPSIRSGAFHFVALVVVNAALHSTSQQPVILRAGHPLDVATKFSSSRHQGAACALANRAAQTPI
mmetsp:Transcript_50065/g.144196  ORF Transcript_50065/g.144196 Transcript_50065/m.144196 type:complete len:275 (+) Transcript_50065:283-1107(+)|eukprot:CAMPEP_0176082112 /NCGR_PEP_ID=MMETSP0120_2-20121206/41073_1 /TAXON_ID=160619 /ORGANISM="Kryptoperidinium foliaceum, Strain CCMP 1326" /LENGTH=274 /DNA_ID=CAMNT_0017415879 /DNA_START=262 /DNA_END=1086 /DNA_ORIENTATION=-